MFKRDRVLNITISNDQSEKLELYYSILDTDLSDRWINLVNENNRLNHQLRYNYQRILDQSAIEQNFQEFRQNIDHINAHYDRKLTDIRNVEYLRSNQTILNDLHEEFEIYGDRLESGYINETIHEAFLRLNEQIHNFESIYRRPMCNCLVDFIPAGLHEDLKSEDFLLFDPTFQWGWAYLGYNTLGKHWTSTLIDQDIDVVKRGSVRPQQRFAAELYMNFSTRDNLYKTRFHLYNWWTKNNFNQYINPELKLRELALGFIPIGRLYSFLPHKGEYTKITESINKEEWNVKVWSKYNRIVEFRIIDTR